MVDEQRVRNAFKNMRQFESSVVNDSHLSDVWFNGAWRHNIHVSTDSEGELYIRSDDVKKLYANGDD